MKFLILHGSFGSAEGNWFPQLKEKLELLNQKVVLEQFPVENWEELTKAGKDYKPERQNLNNWLNFFGRRVFPQVKGEKLVVVAHSLGPLFLLHVVEKFKLKIDTAVFVSPFLKLKRQEKYWQIDVVNRSFYKVKFDFKRLRRLIPHSYVLYSENDPYVPVRRALEFSKKLGSSSIEVLGGQHLNSEVNLNEFPLVLELCKSRIKLTLYQKYLAFLTQYHPSELVREGVGRALLMPASELTKEGVFHFTHLQKGGFCTLPIDKADYWRNKQSVYMEESRKAARRVKIKRIYILENKSDLEKERVMEMMSQDEAAGIKVSYCYLDEIKDRVDELDFGIWDDEYVCTVSHRGGEVSFSLDSRKKILARAKKWQEVLLAVGRKY